MQCPMCKSVDIGKVGSNQYYCWQCLIEIKISPKQQARLFYVEADGTLTPLTSRPE
jgi:translation initiation factor 2 beta subunit (eIF-2beta)/eIF-5